MAPGFQQVLAETWAFVSEGDKVRSYTAREPLPRPWNESDCSPLVSTVQPPVKCQSYMMQIVGLCYLEIRGVGFVPPPLKIGRV